MNRSKDIHVQDKMVVSRLRLFGLFSSSRFPKQLLFVAIIMQNKAVYTAYVAPSPSRPKKITGCREISGTSEGRRDGHTLA